MRVPRLEVISVHVPKTAGLSVRALLESIYGDHLILDYSRQLSLTDPDGRGLLLRLSRLRTLPRRIGRVLHALRGGRCVHGHFAASWYCRDNPDALRVAWMRHPGHRMVSHYLHWRRKGRWGHSLGSRVRAGEYTLEEFMTLNDLADLQLRYIDIPWGAMDFIGLQDRFAADLRALFDRLAPSGVEFEVPEVNVGTGSSEEAWEALPARVKARFEEIHAGDFALYRRLSEVRSGWMERGRDRVSRT